jgi:hypothetical protein
VAGLTIFSERLLQNHLIETQVSDQPLELAVFVTGRFTQLADPEAAKALFAPIEALLADAQFPADVRDGRAGLGLAQGHNDLLLGELARLHRAAPPSPKLGGRWTARYLKT